MTSPKVAWVDEQRPIYARLPKINQRYQAENPENPTNWITRWFDELLVQTKTTLDDLPRQLNALTCDEEWIDFVAYLGGFTGEYWDKSWPLGSKRLIASEANWIWSNKGTRQVLEYLFAALNLDVTIWAGEQFYPDVTPLPAFLGEPTYQYWAIVPITYLRTSPEYRLADRINRLFGAVVSDSRVVYDGFYPGLSYPGDPVFL